MRKFLIFLLVLVIMVPAAAIQAQAAGSASLSGPGVVRAGDTITVSFSAGGGIYGGSGSVSYDSSQLTLQGYTTSIGGSWAVEFSGNNFVFYDNNMNSPITGTKTIFTATFEVSASVAPGTVVTVSVNGVTLSDGKNDTGIGTRSYSVTIAQPLSSNANLAALTVSNAGVSPSFSAATTEYTASVPYSTSSLQVIASTEHAGAKVTVSNTNLAENATTDVQVTVTAENGATKVYHIRVYRARDPNYVESSVNTLDALSVEGFLLSPIFTTDRQDYAIYVPYETESVEISAAVTDSKSKVSIPAADALPVGESTHEIVVTAENGNTSTYTITVFRAEPFDETILPPEETVPETEPETEPATEPTAAPTTQPIPEQTIPQEPAAQPDDGQFRWTWIVIAIAAFALGAGTVLLINKIKKKA